MEPESNRNMDELLKACAKQRKAQAGDPFPLHSATRNLLQTEVSRLAKRKSPPTSAPRLGFWADGWLRLVFGGAICGVLVLIAGVSIRTLSRSPVTYQIAQDTSRQAAEVATSTAPASSAQEPALDSLGRSRAPRQEEERSIVRYGLADSKANLEEAKSPTPVAGGGALRTDVGQRLAGKSTSELLPGSVPTDQSAPTSLARETDLAKRDLARADGIAVPVLTPAADEKTVNARGGISLAAAAAQPAKETQEVLSLAQQTIGPVSYQNTARQRFVQMPSPPKSKVSAKPSAANLVLKSFVVEQDGAQLRFIDADGSIYEGALLNGDAGAARSPASVALSEKPEDTKKLKAAVSRTLNSPKAAALQTAENTRQIQGESDNYQNSSFRVTGTNLSVNQKVVVTGNFILNTNAIAPNSSLAAGQPRSGGLQNIQNTLSLMQSPNSRIYGNAIVGGRTQVEINAKAVAP